MRFYQAVLVLVGRLAGLIFGSFLSSPPPPYSIRADPHEFVWVGLKWVAGAACLTATIAWLFCRKLQLWHNSNTEQACTGYDVRSSRVGDVAEPDTPALLAIGGAPFVFRDLVLLPLGIWSLMGASFPPGHLDLVLCVSRGLVFFGGRSDRRVISRLCTTSLLCAQARELGRDVRTEPLASSEGGRL